MQYCIIIHCGVKLRTSQSRVWHIKKSILFLLFTCEIFFLKFLVDTCLFGGPLVPLFLDFWWRFLWVSKPEWALLYLPFCGGKCNVHSLRSTSGATRADLLAASTQPVTSPYACAEVGLDSDLNGQSPTQKMNALPLCQRPGFTLARLILWDVKAKLQIWNSVQISTFQMKEVNFSSRCLNIWGKIKHCTVDVYLYTLVRWAILKFSCAKIQLYISLQIQIFANLFWNTVQISP